MSTPIVFSFKNNVLYVDESAVEVQFKWPVAEVIAFDNVLVVRVEPDSGARMNENVFGVDRHGNICWTIEERKHVYDDSPYTSIISKDGKVKLSNWDGDELLVEPESGNVISVGYSK